MTDIPHPESITGSEPSPQATAFLTRFPVDGTLVERLGIEILEVGPQRTVARMPVLGNTQPYGLLHGGASAALAETVGSIAAGMHAGADRVAVGVDLSATHHRGVRDGWVTAVATPLSAGRSVATYDIAITDEQGRRVCTSRLTCLLRDAAPGAPSA